MTKREVTKQQGTNAISRMLGWFIDSWLVMLTFGVVHSSDASVPALGYWVCFLVTFVVTGIVSGVVDRPIR